MTSSRHGEARSALREVQSRHEDIKRIERTITELAQLFNEMSIMIEVQETMIDHIEAKAQETEVQMEQGLQETERAVVSARAARKKKWWCIGLIILIIGIRPSGLHLTYSCHCCRSPHFEIFNQCTLKALHTWFLVFVVETISHISFALVAVATSLISTLENILLYDLLLNKLAYWQQIPIQLPISPRFSTLPSVLTQINWYHGIINIHPESRQIQSNYYRVNIINNKPICTKPVEEGKYAIRFQETDNSFEKFVEISVRFSISVVIYRIERFSFT